MKKCYVRMCLLLSLMVSVFYGAQEPKRPQKGIDTRPAQEYCVTLEAFEKLIEILEGKHAQEQERLKAANTKEFSEYMESRNREFSEQEAMRVLEAFKKKGARKAEKLSAQQAQEKLGQIRAFVDSYYPDMDTESLETFCLV